MKKRILIIDNDRQLNKINERVLNASGIVNELHISCDGQEAMDYLKSRVQDNCPLPQIIVLDLQVPVMNGFEFIDEFKKNFPGNSAVELVVFTNSSNPADKQKAMSKGVKHYLNKPYLLRDLRDIASR